MSAGHRIPLPCSAHGSMSGEMEGWHISLTCPGTQTSWAPGSRAEAPGRPSSVGPITNTQSMVRLAGKHFSACGLSSEPTVFLLGQHILPTLHLKHHPSTQQHPMFRQDHKPNCSDAGSLPPTSRVMEGGGWGRQRPPAPPLHHPLPQPQSPSLGPVPEPCPWLAAWARGVASQLAVEEAEGVEGAGSRETRQLHGTMPHKGSKVLGKNGRKDLEKKERKKDAKKPAEPP